MTGADPFWTADEIRLFREMWAQGFKVGQIAERLGRSKSGIWRKRTQLELQPRYETQPAPAAPAPPAPPRPVGKGRTLPPLASEVSVEDAT